MAAASGRSGPGDEPGHPACAHAASPSQPAQSRILAGGSGGVHARAREISDPRTNHGTATMRQSPSPRSKSHGSLVQRLAVHLFRARGRQIGRAAQQERAQGQSLGGEAAASLRGARALEGPLRFSTLYSLYFLRGAVHALI